MCSSVISMYHRCCDVGDVVGIRCAAERPSSACSRARHTLNHAAAQQRDRQPPQGCELQGCSSPGAKHIGTGREVAGAWRLKGWGKGVVFWV